MLKKVKEKEADTKVKTLKQNLEPSARIIVYTPSGKKSLEVLAVSSGIKKYSTSLEELAD